jgi:hypothetical protein
MEDFDEQATCGHEFAYDYYEPEHRGDETPKEGPGDAHDVTPHIQARDSTSLNHPHTTAGRGTTPDADGISVRGSLQTKSHDSIVMNRSSPRTSKESAQPRTSLGDLEKSHTWSDQGFTNANNKSLPPSDVSSLVETQQWEPKRHFVAPARSLEELMLKPEHVALPQKTYDEEQALDQATLDHLKNELGKPDQQIPESRLQASNPTEPKQSLQKSKRPERGKLWNKVLASLGPSGKNKQERKSQIPPVPEDAAVSDAEVYRTNLTKLATQFPNLENVNSVSTRHAWSSRIVFYDVLEAQQSDATYPHEPWPGLNFPPQYQKFHETLRGVPEGCLQRTIFVEDLNPSLVDFLGAAFRIPPHVLEDHLEESGYAPPNSKSKSSRRWQKRFSTQGSSSITWLRPVIPLLSVSSDLRDRLLEDSSPRVRCFSDSCKQQHDVNLRRDANIWRRNLALCPYPGVYHQGSETEYPVAWEKRVTIWTREFDSCRFGK